MTGHWMDESVDDEIFKINLKIKFCSNRHSFHTQYGALNKKDII
jgi:hypothetical protein